MFFAVKRLTNSDLGFFKHLYDSRVSASNQKSINLNAIPFRTVMYPSLREGRDYPIDLRLAGPTGTTEHRLRRKIVRSDNSKNWRLDGEFVPDPEDAPDRYHALQDGDFALMRFDGDGAPQGVRCLLVGAADTPSEHSIVHEWVESIGTGQSMVMLSSGQVDELASRLASPWGIRDLLLDEALIEELEIGGGFLAPSRARMPSPPALPRARPKVPRSEVSDTQNDLAEIGWAGEELVDTHLTKLLNKGEICEFSWVSLSDAYAPYDFRVVELDGSETKLEVKTTRNEFRQTVFLSSAEAAEMVGSGDQYRLLRLYRLDASGASARYVLGLLEPVTRAIQTAGNLPSGVSVRGYAIDLGAVGLAGDAFQLGSAMDAAPSAPTAGDADT